MVSLERKAKAAPYPLRGAYDLSANVLPVWSRPSLLAPVVICIMLQVWSFPADAAAFPASSPVTLLRFGHGVVVPGRMRTPPYLAVHPQTLPTPQGNSRSPLHRRGEAAMVGCDALLTSF